MHDPRRVNEVFFLVRCCALAIAMILVGIDVRNGTVASEPSRRLPPIDQPTHITAGRSSTDSTWESAQSVEEVQRGVIASTEFTSLEGVLKTRGKKLIVRIGGYGKLDVIHDFDAIGDSDQFDVATIPTDGRPGDNTRLHARQTRLNLDTRFKAGAHDVRVFVEGDFFNRDDTSLRLRHAFAEVGGLTAGQTWTTFMDEGPGPRLVDFENPSGYIVDRRALLRYEHLLRDFWVVAVAIEESSVTISESPGTTGLSNSLWPDSIVRIRWERPGFHLQTAAIVREFRFQEDLTNDTQDVTGWGFNFSGTSQLTRCDTAYFEITFGEGIGGFRDIPDAGPDAFGVLEALPASAWNVAWTHDWSERWSSNFIFSSAELTNSAGQDGSAARSVQYLATNLIWSVHDQMDVGMEYLFGKREDKDGSTGEANRLHVGIWFYLP